jgi:putative transcriptional regulator
MKVMRSNLRVLTAQKAQREGRNISLRTVSDETGLNRYVVYGIAKNTLREYPGDAITKLCEYFDCQVGDLLYVDDVPEGVAS